LSQNPTKKQASKVSSATPAERKLEVPAAKEVKLKREIDLYRLRFSPYAYAQLVWLYDRSTYEVGAFGVSSINDPTYIRFLALPKQEVGAASVEFDEDDLPNYMDDMLDEGFQPCECFRIWIHTHPQMGPSPSGTDVSTFREAFGTPSWAIMCIYGKDDQFHAELRHSTGPNTPIALPSPMDVVIDYAGEFEGVSKEDAEEWEQEYVKNVRKRTYTVSSSASVSQKQHDNSGHWPGYGAYGYGCGGHMEDPDPKMEMAQGWDRDAWEDPNMIDAELEEWRRELQERGDGPFDPGEEELIPLDEVSLFFDEYVVDIYRREHLVFVCLEEDWVAYVGEPQDLVSSVTDIVNQVADISRSNPIAFGDLTWIHDTESAEPMITDINTKYGASYVSSHIMLTLDETEIAIISQIETGAAEEAELEAEEAEEADEAEAANPADIETKEMQVADIEEAAEELMVARLNGDDLKDTPSGP
jgi:hypothetical protein